MPKMIKLPRIIAFTGKKGVGKSTILADYLNKSYGYERVKFSGPLKEMLRVLHISEEELEGKYKDQPCGRLYGLSPRQAMQSLGTDWGRRMIHEDFWVSLWDERQINYSLVVCEDVRFPNEAERIRENNGIIIKVVKPAEDDDTHESENNDIEYDYILYNDSTKENLISKLEEILDAIDSSNLGSVL